MLFYLFSEFMDEKKPNIILNRFEDNNYENPLFLILKNIWGQKRIHYHMVKVDCQNHL